MKNALLIGFLASAVICGAAYGQTTAQQPPAASATSGETKAKSNPGDQQKSADQKATSKRRRGAEAATTGAKGHDAPNPQPLKEDNVTAPGGSQTLGTVTLPRGVKANGEPLQKGTYQVRLLADEAKPTLKDGQQPQLERWAEFVQNGKVKGKEVVSIVPQADIAKVQKDAPPKPGTSKVQMLKGNEYVRVWINKGGNYYLIHLVPA